ETMIVLRERHTRRRNFGAAKKILALGDSGPIFDSSRLTETKRRAAEVRLPPAAFFLGRRGRNGALWCQHLWKGRCQDGSTRTRCDGDQRSKGVQRPRSGEDRPGSYSRRGCG